MKFFIALTLLSIPFAAAAEDCTWPIKPDNTFIPIKTGSIPSSINSSESFWAGWECAPVDGQRFIRIRFYSLSDALNILPDWITRVRNQTFDRATADADFERLSRKDLTSDETKFIRQLAVNEFGFTPRVALDRAYRKREKSQSYPILSDIGTIPIGTECFPETGQTVPAIMRVDRTKVKMTSPLSALPSAAYAYCE